MIACMGDSHTWGEGVGAEYGFKPAVTGGDLRMIPWGYPSYVNLLRNAVNLYTGSAAREYCGEELKSLCQSAADDFGIVTGKLSISEKYSLLRIFFVKDTDDTKALVKIGTHEACVTIPKIAPNELTNSSVICKTFLCENEETNLEIVTQSEQVIIHRIELYSGEYAVVNAGVGSCNIKRYIDFFFDSYIKSLDPFAVIFEGCTINDWLLTEPVSSYGNKLSAAFEKLGSLTDKILVHTPFPIAGDTVLGEGKEDYREYIEKLKAAAEHFGVPVCDTYGIMNDLLSAAPSEKRMKLLYHDNWHPNGTGHYIYAYNIFKYLRKFI